MNTKVAKSGIDPSLTANIKAESGQNTNRTIDVTLRRVYIRVRSAGNDTWVVSELDGRPIDEQIMNNTTLFYAKLEEQANRYALELLVRAKKSDVSLEYRGTLARLSVNKQKVLAALLLKCLPSDQISEAGALHLSMSEMTYE